MWTWWISKKDIRLCRRQPWYYKYAYSRKKAIEKGWKFQKIQKTKYPNASPTRNNYRVCLTPPNSNDQLCARWIYYYLLSLDIDCIVNGRNK